MSTTHTIRAARRHGRWAVLAAVMVAALVATLGPAAVAAPAAVSTTTTYEAESGTVGGGTRIDSEHQPFTGTGYANFPASGGSLQVNNVNGGAGGSATMTIRYANGSGSSRTGRLVVNGVGQNLTTPATGAWNSWQTMPVTVSLTAGTANTIRFESTGQDLANIDHIMVAVNDQPAAPTITTQPASQTVRTGSSVTFTVVASGTEPLSYQWRHNGADIAGATAASYTISDVQDSHVGEYTVVVSNSLGSVTSNPATLTIDDTAPSVVRPRVINMTDLGADPDDLQSLVRMLVTVNEVDLEGIIGTTSCWRRSQSSSNMNNLLNPRLNAYGQVLPNLQRHAEGYPSLSYLQSISRLGQTGYGMADVGSGKDSAGSEMIIAAVDRDDPRPVWVNVWGGANTLAQALWKVKNTRSQAQVDQFVSKLRVYDILGQDDAGAWMTKNFPNLLYIRAGGLVYSWQPSDGWLDTNVQNHGPLGAQYPDRKYATEGDTPSFLHQLPYGLTDPNHVDWGGWGGRFGPAEKAGVRGMSCLNNESSYDPYYMYHDASDGWTSISRWGAAVNNDFAARMDWSITSNYSGANHHPIAVVNGDNTKQVLQISATAGSNVNLNAAGSSDPDGNPLTYSWSFYDEPSTYNGAVTIQNSTSASATVQIPSNAGGKNLHIILTLRDNGSPNLYSYRRIIINVR